MIGMSRTTGKALDDRAHLRQSIIDILTTPLGSRVMRRTYGSRLVKLIDAPMNRDTLLKIYGAVVEALTQWEPRIQVLQVTSQSAAPGAITLDLSGIYLPNGKPISISGISVGQ
jgi:phage baseplate assembly protein W